MHSYLNSLAWIRSGLFWRTFFLLVLLVTASMATWFTSFKVVERKPRAQQISGQIVSFVTLTRAALTHSAPERRRELLLDLAKSEGIRIYLLEDTDRVIVPNQSAFFDELNKLVKNKLDAETRFAIEVNGESGFWVSFSIDNDQYWLRLEQGRIQTETGLQFLGWITITLLLTLIGAVFISQLINEPLSRLSIASRLIAKGQRPNQLPEKGPREIRETNASFNQMVEDLAQIDSDRTIILAGISHDLRTPLTRMQLEVEMAPLDEMARQGMQSDLAQMDEIIHQFLDYAKPLDDQKFGRFNISELCEQVFAECQRMQNISVNMQIEPQLFVEGLEVEIKRLLNNLIENAKRHGRTSQDSELTIDFSCAKVQNEGKNQIQFIFRDHGNGVPESDLQRILRPFTRVDLARGQASGSGLGLAIVDRIVKRHGGKVQLTNHEQGGLQISIQI